MPLSEIKPDRAPVTTSRDRALGAFIGLAVGDALGAAVEFKPRGSFPSVTTMRGGGPFNLPIGCWTDDTSLGICLAESLRADAGLNPIDLLQRFSRWMRSGENSSTGVCFGVGTTTSDSIARFERTGEALPISGAGDSDGNGSIIRLAPAVVRWWCEPEKAVEIAGRQGRTTHTSRKAIDCCELLAVILCELLARGHSTIFERNQGFRDTFKFMAWDETVRGIASGETWRGKRVEDIRSSGYVVDTLEAALWAVDGASGFAEAVLRAVNLGDDADSVGAVAGQIAGARWGLSSIPDAWLAVLHQKDRLVTLASDLYSDGETSTLSKG